MAFTVFNGGEFSWDGDFNSARQVDVFHSEYAMYRGRLAPGLVQRAPFWQSSLTYSPLAMHTVCPVDAYAYLVDETPRVSLGGGALVAWERVFARVPTPMVRYENFTYPFQKKYSAGSPAVNYIFNYPFSRVARIFATFHRTFDPSTITVNRLPRTTVVNGNYEDYDGWFQVSPGQTVIAADDELEEWMTGIWVRTQRSIRV